MGKRPASSPGVGFPCAPSLSQLTEMNEQEDAFLVRFSALPQLKQVVTDKESLVRNIEELARKSGLPPPLLPKKRL